MLTEPSTMPPQTKQQVIYGLVVGAFASSQARLGALIFTPEISLLIGNLYAYAVSPKFAVRLKLKQIHQLSAQVYDYEFTPDYKPRYLAGQYFAWTLPHAKADIRGNRRTFTIASSPTEDTVRLSVKFYEPSSTFKSALKKMKPGDTLLANQLAGSFTLPRTSQKLAFIAGGIGITPFRSMIKYIIDTNQQVDITLFYLVATPDEVAFNDVWKAAAGHGVKVIPVLGSDTVPAGWKGLQGRLTTEIFQQYLPDFAKRTFYISGPPPMVKAYKTMLKTMHVSRQRIKADYFSGY